MERLRAALPACPAVCLHSETTFGKHGNLGMRRNRPIEVLDSSDVWDDQNRYRTGYGAWSRIRCGVLLGHASSLGGCVGFYRLFGVLPEGPGGVQITHVGLTVELRLGRKSFGPIVKIFSAEEPSGQSIRLWGNGGLFAGTGLFWNSKWGRYRAYITRSPIAYTISWWRPRIGRCSSAPKTPHGCSATGKRGPESNAVRAAQARLLLLFTL